MKSSAKWDPSKRIRLRKPRGKSKVLFKDEAMDLLYDLVRQLGYKLEIEGAERASEENDRLRFVVTPGGDGEDHAWKVGRVDGVFGIMGGAYNTEEIPFTELDTDFTGWVYLAASWDLTLVDDYVWPAELNNVVLATGVSVPADEPEAAVFYIPLVEMSNGKVASQAATRSISATVCDRAADGGAMHTILQS
jgi:hypothetical protein